MKNLILICIGIFAVQISFGQIDCDRSNNVAAINQKIREKTYQYILLARDTTYNIKKDSLASLAIDYIEIQTSFNVIFSKMKDDKAHFASKRKICDRYSNELNTLITQVTNYDNRILRMISPNTKSSNFGVSDVLDIIDWLYKKYQEGNSNFYDKVKWANWADIGKPENKTGSGDNSSDNSQTSNDSKTGKGGKTGKSGNNSKKKN